MLKRGEGLLAESSAELEGEAEEGDQIHGEAHLS